MTVPKFVISDEEGEDLEAVEPVEKIAVKAKTVRQDPKPSRPVGRPPKSDKERELAEELEIMFMMASGVWSNFDQECGPVLEKQSKQIANALAHTLSKNPKLLERVMKWSVLGDWGPIFFAFQPVIKSIAKHHIMKPEVGQNASAA